MPDAQKIALRLTLVLATASPALASDRPDRTSSSTYGGPAQTLQDIERSRADIQQRIQKEYHYGTAAGGIASSEKPHRRSGGVH